MAPTPLIAIPAYRLAAGRVLDWSRGGYAVPDGYVAALQRAGARVVLVPPDRSTSATDTLAPFDGLLLAGGGDVDPRRYGAPPHPSVYGIDDERDEAELALVSAGVEAGLAVFAICRGMQVLNVALGGTLHQHLPELQGMDLHGKPGRGLSVVHDVKVLETSLLGEACASEVLRCTSHHHQAVDRLGAGLAAIGWSGDGLVEAVQVGETGRPWVLGVQWHPELTAAEDPMQQALFEAFVAAARGRRSQR